MAFESQPNAGRSVFAATPGPFPGWSVLTPAESRAEASRRAAGLANLLKSSRSGSLPRMICAFGVSNPFVGVEVDAAQIARRIPLDLVAEVP